MYGCWSTLSLFIAKTSISSLFVLKAPSPLGPSMHLKDVALFANKIFTIRLQTDVSVIDDSIDPSSWSGTESKHGFPHSCNCLKIFQISNLLLRLEFLIMRLYGASSNLCATVLSLPISERFFFLPFSFGQTFLHTPTSLGKLLESL